jgi:hypothetical protein
MSTTVSSPSASEVSAAPLAGRVVVTGASSGIGTASAALLAERGARVALLARRKERPPPQGFALDAGRAEWLLLPLQGEYLRGARPRPRVTGLRSGEILAGSFLTDEGLLDVCGTVCGA